MKIWTILPAYNEGKNLEKLLLRLKEENNISVLVVDDGSKDESYQIAKEHASIVLKNDKNQGKGLSLKKAINYLLEKEQFDYVLIMDADNQHCPDDIKLFVEQAQKGEVFIIGNRMVNTKSMPVLRVFTNKFMSSIISFVIRQKIEDTQCGFRLIAKSVLENLNLRTNNFEIESEILIRAARNKVKISSVPIKTIYFKGHFSKINPFIDTIRFVWFLLTV